MINVILRGDFGNQLFQYAIGRRLALQHNTNLQFILSNRLSFSDWNGKKLMNKLSCFQLPVEYKLLPPYKARVCNALRIRCRNVGAYYREPKWGFNPEALNLPNQSYLFGYFQSEKYFKNIAPIIRDDLTIHVPFENEELLKVEKTLSQHHSVSVHVRRGDYIKSKRHNVCDLTYFNHAIRYMRQQLEAPRFFVFSDDIAWCRSNMGADDVEFIEASSLGEQPMTDFRLMSLCKNNIISNSSFSWWAAWLNKNPDKIVVTPNRWYNDEPLNSLAIRDTIPEGWVKIDF